MKFLLILAFLVISVNLSAKSFGKVTDLSMEYEKGIELLDLWTRGASLREAHEDLQGKSLEEAHELLKHLLESPFVQSCSSNVSMLELAQLRLQIDVLLTEG